MGPPRNDTNIDFAKVTDMPVLDEDGKEVVFGTLYRDKKTIVVFIRHFNCGVCPTVVLFPYAALRPPIKDLGATTEGNNMCQLYIEALAKVRPEALEAADTNMIFIGCGDPVYLKGYRETTQFKGAGYADPTRKLFAQLGFGTSLSMGPGGEQRAAYLKDTGRWSSIAGSVWKSLKMPIDAMFAKPGNITQLGGEFILGPGDVCSFASRMRHTQDHVDVPDLMKAAGVEYP